MTNKSKVFLLWSGLFVWAITILSLPIARESLLIRAVVLFPILCIGTSHVLFQWPKFASDFMDEVVERDSKRGVYSIHNMGLVMLVVSPIIIYALFS